jgi:hypothetical protein
VGSCGSCCRAPRLRRRSVVDTDVKDVSVTVGPSFDGEATDRISGVIDTVGLVEGSLKRLGSAARFAQLPDLSEFVRDTKVVLYLSQTTHLPLRVLVDLQGGREVGEVPSWSRPAQGQPACGDSSSLLTYA